MYGRAYYASAESSNDIIFLRCIREVKLLYMIPQNRSEWVQSSYTGCKKVLLLIIVTHSLREKIDLGRPRKHTFHRINEQTKLMKGSQCVQVEPHASAGAFN